MSRMWGVEVRSRMVRQTPFVCPRCGLDREGAEVEPQRWFTVLHLPLIPLATMDHVVECETCGHRCDLGVLDIPTTDVLAAYLSDALRHGVATIVRSGAAPSGEVADDVRELAMTTIRANRHDYDLDRLDDDLTGLDDIATAERLGRLVDELTAHGKQIFLHRMAAIALADGPIKASERQALGEMGVALGMSAPHINGVLAVASLQPEAA